jgi:carboxymethylenebutenolidase
MASETLTFTSGGEPIRIEAVRAPQPGFRPAVVLLHGADGLTRGDHYRLAAQLVASAGYHTFLLHYLDRTRELRADYRKIKQHLPHWVRTVRDALDFVLQQPGVQAECLGIIGTSLGAGIAFAAASDDDRIKAIVDYFGFLPETVKASAARLPPTLILHGALDAIVPVQNANAIEALLQRLNVPHELHIYPDQAHSFRGDAALDAAHRTATFLQRYLPASAGSS